MGVTKNMVFTSVADVEKWAEGKFHIPKAVGSAAVKSACTAANTAIDTQIRAVLAGATGGTSVAVNGATRAITGGLGMFGVGPGKTDAVMEADKKIMKAIGCTTW